MALPEVPEEILDAVKNHLDMTYQDDAADQKLQGIIVRGIRYLNDIAGIDQDYTDQSCQAFELLLEYCLYVRSNALAEFQRNYQHELLSFQLAKEVELHEAN